MYIENDFIDKMKKEDTDPVDDASEHDIQKAVVEICGDAEKIIQLWLWRFVKMMRQLYTCEY